jgi:hypothetical protein
MPGMEMPLNHQDISTIIVPVVLRPVSRMTADQEN